MLNTREATEYLGVNGGTFSTFIVPAISHLREKGLSKNEWFYKEADLIKIKPFLDKYGCGRMAARAIKQFYDEETK